MIPRYVTLSSVISSFIHSLKSSICIPKYIVTTTGFFYSLSMMSGLSRLLLVLCVDLSPTLLNKSLDYLNLAPSNNNNKLSRSSRFVTGLMAPTSTSHHPLIGSDWIGLVIDNIIGTYIAKNMNLIIDQNMLCGFTKYIHILGMGKPDSIDGTAR